MQRIRWSNRGIEEEVDERKMWVITESVHSVSSIQKEGVVIGIFSSKAL